LLLFAAGSEVSVPLHDTPGATLAGKYPRRFKAGRPCYLALAAPLLVLFFLAAFAAPAAAGRPVLVSPSRQALPAAQSGTEGEKLFQTRCAGCHSIGQGKLVGPDLEGVTARRAPAWIKSFVSDPSRLFAANDPTAQQLLKDSNGVQMPTLGLSPAQVDALVAYLGQPGSPVGAVPVAATAAGDPAAGQLLFTGTLPLAGGGPACIACHSVNGTGALGGGALGPNLTHVAQRLGQPGLAATLQSIVFPTMVGPFTNRPLTAKEQADLVQFLVQADTQAAPVPLWSPGAITAATWTLLALGLAGAAGLFALLLIFWPRQRQSISARLRSTRRPGQAR
jgi:mono/diheme cytochrome c family protein